VILEFYYKTQLGYKNMLLKSKKYRYHVIKQKEEGKLKIQKNKTIA